MIRGLVLDLDGVITDTAEYHYLAWKALAKQIGISIDRKFNEQLKGVSRTESLELILRYGDKINDFSEKEKEELAYKKNEAYKQSIKEITPSEIAPGISKLLEDAKSSGIKLSVASASKNAPDILKHLEIIDLFEGIVDPASLTNGKPDPEIFIRGADLLGLNPSECIGIEDSTVGIEAINRAGMFSIGVGSITSMEQADYIVENTNELSLENLLAKAEIAVKGVN